MKEVQNTEQEQPEMGTPEFMDMCIDARIKEVQGYQFNIENYKLAIQHIEANPEVAQRQGEFLAQLRELLGTELIQQERAQIMLDVLLKRAKLKEVA